LEAAVKDYDRMRMIEAFNAPAKSPTQEAYERGRADERADVVAWLLPLSPDANDLARMIARGRHLRKREGGEG